MGRLQPQAPGLAWSARGGLWPVILMRRPWPCSLLDSLLLAAWHSGSSRGILAGPCVPPRLMDLSRNWWTAAGKS